MSITIKDVRAKYPQYSTLSDDQLAEALHKKFYSSMDIGEFKGRIGLAPPADAPEGPSWMDTIKTAMLTGGRPNAEQLSGLKSPQADQALPQVTPVPAPAPSIMPPAVPQAPVPVQQGQPDAMRPQPRPIDVVLQAMGAKPSMFAPTAPAVQPVQPTALSPAAAPVDPFAGEGFGALAARRGQQAAAGATEVVASVPEALAVTRQGIVRGNQDANISALNAEIAGLEADAASLEGSIPSLPDQDSQTFAREEVARMRALANQRKLLLPSAERPVDAASDTPLFAKGDTIRAKSAETFGTPDPRDDSFWGQVAYGAGNVAGMATAGIAGTALAGPAGGLAVGGGTGAAMNATQLYKEAKDAGADEETATQAAQLGGVIGASEILPITRALKLLPPRLRGELTKGFMRKAVDIAQSAGEEAAQEYLAAVANNIVAQQLYDPERGWTENATEQALVGAVLGGGTGAIGTAFDRGEKPKPDAAAPAGQPESATPLPAQDTAPAAAPEQAAPQPAPKAPAAPMPADPASAVQQDVAQPAQPTPVPPAPETAAAPQVAPQAPAQPATGGISRAEVEANPDRYEIIDETEGAGSDIRATGNQVVVDNETGRVLPLAPDAAAVPAAAVARAPSGGDSTGSPQAASDGAEAPAAGPVTEAAVVAATGQPVPPAPASMKNQPRNFEFIDAAGVQNIGTQPDVMQYKAGGDTQGVTDRLKGVKEWRPERAGMSIIYEYADGRRVIADGHQRLGLAKRLAGEGQKIQMPAMILREVDGVTPKEARVSAALKNIAEGSGTALDAAKVLRESTETVDQLGLPPNSAIVRDAIGMRSLSDQAFGMVANGVASERDGGIVGRVVQDGAAQANILGLLTRLQKDRPITAFQAESVAKQAAADTVTETQDSLFGPEQDTQNLYLERAKALETAIRMVRDEKRAFKNVFENAERLEKAGNKLDQDSNKSRVDKADAIGDYLAKEANTKGPISDALTAAARALRGGSNATTAARQFLDAAERELGSRGGQRPSGDSRGQAAGTNRPQEPETGPVEPARDEDAAAGDLFGGPAPAAPQPKPQDTILAAMTGKTAEAKRDGAPVAQPKSADKPAAAQTFPTVKDWSNAVLRALKLKIKKDGSANVTISRLRILRLTKPDQVDSGFSAVSDGIKVRRGNNWDMMGMVEADALAQSIGLPARFEAVPQKAKPEAPSTSERIKAAGARLGVTLTDADYGKIIAALPNRAMDADIDAAVQAVGDKAKSAPPPTIESAKALVDKDPTAPEVLSATKRVFDRIHDNPSSSESDDTISVQQAIRQRKPATRTGDTVQIGKLTVSSALYDDALIVVADEERFRRAMNAAIEAAASTPDYIRESMRAAREQYRRNDPVEIDGFVDLSESEQGKALIVALAESEGSDARKAVADRWIHNQGKKTGIEHAVFLDSQGLPLVIASGSKTEVNFPTYVMLLSASGRVAYTVHNHPSSRGASYQDIRSLFESQWDDAAIMAADGGRYVIARGPIGKDLVLDMGYKNSDFEALHDKIDGPLTRIMRKRFPARADTQEEVDAANAKVDRANAAFDAIINLVYDKLGILKVSGDIRAKALEGTDGDQDLDAIIAEVADQVAADGAVRRAGFKLAPRRDTGGDRAAAKTAPERTGSGPDRGADTGAGTGDGRGRADTAGKVGNPALDSALDDIFGGESDVSGSSPDMAGRGRDGNAADGLGARSVSSAARPAGRSDRNDGGQPAGQDQRNPASALPDSNAPTVGARGDTDLFGNSGADGGLSADRDGGRRAGGGNRGLPDDAGRKGDTAGNAAGPAKPRTAAERLAAVRAALKEDTKAWIAGPSLREDTADKIDTRKAEALAEIFNEALDGVDVARSTDRQIFAHIILPLKDAGMTREEVAVLSPYLEAYLADLRAARTAPQAPAPKPIEAEDSETAQAKADRAPVVFGDRASIENTLPLLLPEQRDDVFKAETRFAKPDGHGFLLTNGTGTGKTYSGGGVVKRFYRAGKKNILIIAPDATHLGWSKTLDALGVPSSKLRDTRDAGEGVVYTTHQNVGANLALATRDWDLVVVDEAQYLLQNQDSNETSVLSNLRAITNRPKDLWLKSRMIHTDDWAAYAKMKDGEAKTARYRQLIEREKREIGAMAQKPRAKALFLSATPFAYDKSIDYAEGYLFNYPSDGKINGSNQDGRSLFMVENFGYRIRYHRLTRPEHAVDSAVFEREFHEKLRREGVLSGRSLQVDVDYDRRFVTVADAVGTEIDAILETLRDGRNHSDKSVADGYRTLGKVMKDFGHIPRMQLLEAIKGKAAVPDIEAHLALGRKVVVFHDFNKGGGFNPFAALRDTRLLDDSNALKALSDLSGKHPGWDKLDFTGYPAPATGLKTAFGKRAGVFSGLTKKDRDKQLAAFNTDGSGLDVLIVQADAGGAGVSMHDLTGDYQRVLINLGMPTKPTTTLQQEGRILRVGTKTNAAFRYYTIGTNWERQAFAKRIAERSGTVENLALGNEARTITEAFIDAYMDAEPITPSANDGKGGKEKDRAKHVTTPWEKAVSYYFGRMKTTGRRDQRQGLDFYATPEPLGLKMVEWAGIRANERVIEPSAGDGAIARFMPDDASITIIEPSTDLGSTALLRQPRANLVDTTFEAFSVVNKAHVIVMNPPFGSGGKTAMEHLAKAARHLRDGGRIVALIPSGPSADKRFDAWRESDDAASFVLTANIALPAVVFEKAGTNVMTRVVVLDKITSATDRVTHAAQTGETKQITFTGYSTIKDFFAALKMYELPPRPAPKMDVLDEIAAEGVDELTPPETRAASPALAGSKGAFTLSFYKSQKGKTFPTAIHAARLDRAEYDAMRAVADKHSGWRVLAGQKRDEGPTFAFKTEAMRRAFLDDVAQPTLGGFSESSTDVMTPAFKEWFGDSKVVDADGKPLVVYHGTNADFEAFDPVRKGSHFGTKSQAAYRGNVENGQQIIPVYLSIKNPKRVKDTTGWVLKVKQAKEEGYDGIVYLNRVEGVDTDAMEGYSSTELMNMSDSEFRRRFGGEDSYIAFSPTQIKSVFNRGAWDVNDPRILYQRAQMVRDAAASTEEINRVMPALRAELDRLDLKRVKLSTADLGQGNQGRFTVTGDGAMEIVIGASLDPEKTLHHEVIHALRAMDAFLPDEWNALALAAEKRWLAQYDIAARYPDLTPTEQIEEAVAEAFSEAIAATKAPQGSMLIRAFNKIARVLRAFRNAFNGAGHLTPESIFGDILAGEIGRRAAHNTGLRVKYQRRDTGTADMFAQPEEPKRTGMTEAQRREMEARQQQSKIRKTGGNSGDAGPLFNDDKDLFGQRTMFQRAPMVVRPLTAQARANRNSAVGQSPFIPDRRVWETLTQASVPVWQRLRALPAAASDAVDRARFEIQDRFLAVRRAQEAVMRATGHPLPKDQDAYVLETTFSGKVGRHLLDIDEGFTKPIIEGLAKTNGRVTVDLVGQYLYARHAVERNKHIASINPDMPDGGSGMTDAEAGQILAQAAASPDAALYQRIGQMVDDLRDKTLTMRENAGLISNADAALWRAQYKHYVPLKGFEETDHSEAVMGLGQRGTGRGYNVRGPESRRALGRRSEAFNPLQSVITMAQEVAIRAEKNVVAQSLFELAKSNPAPALWEVKKPTQKRYYNRTTGLVETRVELAANSVLEPNEMAVKISGQEHRILFNDQRLAEAAMNIGADQMGGLVRVMSMFSRFFSMTRTMLNPEFVITNAFRDIQTAQFNIQAFGEADKSRIAKAMVKNWRKAFMGAMRGSTYRFDTKWAKHYDEFQKAGAQVWFWNMENPEAGREDLGRRIELARGTKAQRALKTITTPSALLSFRDNPALAYIERVNLAVDNATRLAAFAEAREAGWSVQDAAFLAKELTVNFNRRGVSGGTLNAFYPFFNAAIQGSVRTAKALTSRRVQIMVATAFAAGILLDMANAAGSEEDDDGELVYDKVADYRNERNLHIGFLGNSGNPIAIPMPYGYNLFPYAGQQVGKVLRGVKSPTDAFADVTRAAIGAFSPVNAATPAQLITPVIADPLVEMAENKNWLGIPIYPETFGNQTEPDAYTHFKGATEAAKTIAQGLNSLTGGDFRQSGWIDVSPETIDHLSSFVTGSTGAFIGRTTDFMAKVLSGNADEIEQSQIPFVRTVTSPVDDRIDRDRYYRFTAEVKDAQADRKAYEAAGVPVPPKTAALAQLYEHYLAAQRERNGTGEWNQSKAGAQPQRDDAKVMLDFNRKYISAMGRHAE